MSSPYLSQINVYPAKSVAGISMSSSWVEKQGLAFDRRFMIAQPDGQMVTARKHPQLVLVKSSLLSNGVVFSAPNMPSLTVLYSDLSMDEVETTVWHDQFVAYHTTDAANAWFSQILGKPATLIYCGEQSNRVRDKFGHNVSFADGYPVLVISQASLDELNRRIPETHSMDQFRTNLVVAGGGGKAQSVYNRG